MWHAALPNSLPFSPPFWSSDLSLVCHSLHVLDCNSFVIPKETHLAGKIMGCSTFKVDITWCQRNKIHKRPQQLQGWWSNTCQYPLRSLNSLLCPWPWNLRVCFLLYSSCSLFVFWALQTVFRDLFKSFVLFVFMRALSFLESTCLFLWTSGFE